MEMEMYSKEIDIAYFEMMERISKIFSSEPGLRTAKKYMQGLLSPKNGKTDGKWRKQ